MIALRPIQATDEQTLYEWAQLPRFAEFFRRFPPSMDWQPGTVTTLFTCGYMIYSKEQPAPVGVIQLETNDPLAKSVAVGMLVDAVGEQKKRISLEAYKQISDYIFNYLNYNKIYMKVLAHRTALVERLQSGGWQVESRLRQSCRFNGQLHDELGLGLLKQDYKKWAEALDLALIAGGN